MPSGCLPGVGCDGGRDEFGVGVGRKVGFGGRWGRWGGGMETWEIGGGFDGD